jgi:hypothetical protein
VFFTVSLLTHHSGSLSGLFFLLFASKAYIIFISLLLLFYFTYFGSPTFTLNFVYVYLLLCISLILHSTQTCSGAPFLHWFSCSDFYHTDSPPSSGLARSLPCPTYSYTYHNLSIHGLFIALMMVAVSSSEMSSYIGKYLPDYMVLHPRIEPSSYTLL